MAFDFENGSYTDAAGRTVLDPAVYKDWQIGAAADLSALFCNTGYILHNRAAGQTPGCSV